MTARRRTRAVASVSAPHGVVPDGSGRSISAAGIPVATATTYALLVGVLWLPFGQRSGMGYETTLVYLSESRGFLDGFFYDWDPLRQFTTVFYHLGYQLSFLLNVDGSFVGNQIVYALLWWSRGLLVFLIVRRLLPGSPLLAYAAGALTIVHASDGALNWVGQLNQFGVIFWALLAVYLLIVALQQPKWRRAAPVTVLAAMATYVCLWSYESPLFVLLLAPLLLLVTTDLSRRTAAIAGAFYVAPVVFVVENLQRYVGGQGGTYQESVLRDDLSPVKVLGDWAFNVGSSVRFWEWQQGLPVGDDEGRAVLAGLAAAAVLALGSVSVWILRERSDVRVSRRALTILLGAGLLFLVASFPAYLVLTSARSLWRTQFLSGVGFGIAAAALIVLAASSLRRESSRLAAVAIGGALVAYAGGSAAYRAAAHHYEIWSRHREAISQVLTVAPRVSPETVIVLTNVPSDADPFGHNMWFDVALRLAYPRTPVAGIYFLENGNPAPGVNLVVKGDEWRQQPTGFQTLLATAPFSKTVIVRFSSNGNPTVVQQVPSLLHAGARAVLAYAPERVVEARDPSPLAVRRYGGD